MWPFSLFFKKEEEPEISYHRPADITIEEVQIDIPKVEWIVDNREKNAPVILIMDDFKGMAHLIKDELERITCCDVTSNFSIVLATGVYAGFSVENAIEDDDLIVDIAFLDITLGGVINGVEYDGIDVSIMIKNSNPNSEIRFVTGHTLNRKNPEIFQFITRFEKYFNMPIDETVDVIGVEGLTSVYKHIIQKNSDRIFLLGHTVKTWLDRGKVS